jgi:hypothetical protein
MRQSTALCSELTAVTLFALNLGITVLLPPPYPAVLTQS